MSDDEESKTSSVSISDLVGASAPVKALVNRLANGFGIRYEPSRIERKAKAEAEATIIKAKAKEKAIDIKERARRRRETEEIRHQENIENITYSSLSHISEDAKPDKIEEDWLAYFFESCKNFSNEEVQETFARILAGEANNQGSFSKKTISIISMMSQKHADLFVKFCTFIWRNTQGPLFFDLSNKYFDSHQYGVIFTSLCDIGLTEMVSHIGLGSSFNHIFPKGTRRLEYHNGNAIILQVYEQKEVAVPFGSMWVTEAGKELVPIIDVTPDMNYFDYCVERFRETPDIKVISVERNPPA